MATVGEVVDRVRFEYLEPADELWVSTVLNGAVTDVATTWTLNLDLLGFEEQQLLGGGVLLEADSEQVQVVSVSGSVVTVRRAVRGTTAVAHADDAEVRVIPPFTRAQTFNAVADAIVGLHPPLFIDLDAERTVDADGWVTLPSGTVTPTEVRYADDRLKLDFADLGVWDGQHIIKVYGPEAGKTVRITSQGRFVRPEREDQTLTSLGVRDEWVRIVVVAAAAQLVSGRPLSTAQQEFVAGQLRTEGYPVETPSRIRDQLVRYREYLVDQAVRALMQEHPPTVVRT